MKELIHIDCFSGPGGITTGFKAAGIKTVLAIEKVKSCVDTFMANHPEVSIIHKDIREVKKEDIERCINSKADVDIVTAGMPCETFSTAGSKSRSFYDHRQFLFSEAIRIAQTVNSKLLLLENVPGILTKKTVLDGDKLIIDEILDQLSERGYKYHVKTTLNASEFGIPQARERFFLLASNDSELNLKIPVSVHNGKVSVKDAFAGLPKVEANEPVTPDHYSEGDTVYTKLLKDNAFWKIGSKNTKLTYHIPPKHRPKTIKRFELIKPGEGLKDLFDKFSKSKIKSLQEEGILPKKWYIQRNRRLKNNEPSFTVTSHCIDEMLHPSSNRALTIREVARLQSFPDAYDFKGGPIICPHIYETQDKYEQVGDAVPPLLAYKWGLVIKEILRA
jgi:DNA (cytosine-5)-methyltransferase 1